MSRHTIKVGWSNEKLLTEQQKTHFGGADLLHAQATIADQGGNPWSGASAIKIDDYKKYHSTGFYLFWKKNWFFAFYD